MEGNTRKNAQLVTSLQQTCIASLHNNLLTGCARTGCPKLVDKLLQACSRLAQAWWTQQPCYKFVTTTCYRAASQQLVNTLWVTNLVQLDKITALLQTCWQACYKLVASTTCWQVVRFYVCTWNEIFEATFLVSTTRDFYIQTRMSGGKLNFGFSRFYACLYEGSLLYILVQWFTL